MDQMMLYLDNHLKMFPMQDQQVVSIDLLLHIEYCRYTIDTDYYFKDVYACIYPKYSNVLDVCLPSIISCFVRCTTFSQFIIEIIETIK